MPEPNVFIPRTCECGGELQELFYWLNGEQGQSTDEYQCDSCGKIIPI